MREGAGAGSGQGRGAGAPSNAWRISIHCGLLAPPPLVSTRRRGEAPSEASAAYLEG